MADTNQTSNALFGDDGDDGDDGDEGTLGNPVPSLGLGDVLNNSDTAPPAPFFLTQQAPFTQHANPAGVPAGWFNPQPVAPPQIMYTQQQPLAGPPVPEESLHFIMHDTYIRAPGNNPYNQAAAPSFLQDSQPSYEVAVPFDIKKTVPLKHGKRRASIADPFFDSCERNKLIACDCRLGNIIEFYRRLESRYGALLKVRYTFHQCAHEALRLGGRREFRDVNNNGKFYDEERELIAQYVTCPKEWQELWEKLVRKGFYRGMENIRRAVQYRSNDTRFRISSIEQEENVMETLANNKAALAVDPNAFGPPKKGFLQDGIKPTEEQHGMRKKALREKVRKMPLSKIRPTPWKPTEDHAYAADVQGEARIPGRNDLSRARRSAANLPWRSEEDQYLIDHVPHCNRDLTKLCLQAHKDNRLMHRGQGEIKSRYTLLRAYRAREIPNLISPEKDTSPNLDNAPDVENKQIRPHSVSWTQNEDEALVNAVFQYMQNPSMFVPDFRAIAPFVTTRDWPQCAVRYAVLEQRYWI